MTDRVRTLIVSLTEDMRSDDVQSLIVAIKQMRHVADVGIEITDVTDWDAREKVKWQLDEKLRRSIKEVLWPNRS